MEPDGKTYLLPHPAFVRLLLTLAGAFALIMAPYELWRGVWPLNFATPFFGAIMLAAMALGATFLYGGLIAPAARLCFSPGSIDVFYESPWGRSHKTIPAEDIRDFIVEQSQLSEGPNDWFAVIRLSNGEKLQSRPLATRQAAERQLAEFKAALENPRE